MLLLCTGPQLSGSEEWKEKECGVLFSPGCKAMPPGEGGGGGPEPARPLAPTLGTFESWGRWSGVGFRFKQPLVTVPGQAFPPRSPLFSQPGQRFGHLVGIRSVAVAVVCVVLRVALAWEEGWVVRGGVSGLNTATVPTFRLPPPPPPPLGIREPSPPYREQQQQQQQKRGEF